MATRASHAAPWAKSLLDWTLPFSGSSQVLRQASQFWLKLAAKTGNAPAECSTKLAIFAVSAAVSVASVAGAVAPSAGIDAWVGLGV
jgi:hypothetical protein